MDTRIELRHLRYFSVVADELNFSRAAARLNIAQPALTRQIHNLEELLGCRLFERKPRVALTPAGCTLLAVCHEIFARLEQGITATTMVGRGQAGVLRIGYAASAVLRNFAEIIATYRASFPDVRLELRGLSPSEEIGAVEEGSIDIGFVRELSTSENLAYEIMFTEGFGVLLPEKHVLSSLERVTPALLSGEPFVHFAPEVAPTLYHQVLQLCSRAGFTPHVVQEVREWPTHFSLIAAGIGVGVVPASLQKIRWRGVKFKPLKGTTVRTAIALCHRRAPAHRIVSAFIEISRELSSLTDLR